MILVVTHRRGFEADFVIDILRSQDVPVVRVNLDEYPFPATMTARWKDRIFDGMYRDNRKEILFDDVSVAWLQQVRRFDSTSEMLTPSERIIAAEKEAFIGGFWDSASWSWVNHPTVVETASNKLYQLRVAQQLGFAIPRTFVTADEEKAIAFIDQCADNAIIKDMATQTFVVNNQDYMSYTRKISADDIRRRGIPGGIPVCIQENVTKHREIRATVVGDRVFSVAIDSQAEESTKDDYRHGDLSKSEHYSAITLSTDTEERCVTLVRSLGLDYGAVDLIERVEGGAVFLEVNTTGAWVWAEKLTSLPISAALADLLISRYQSGSGEDVRAPNAS